MLVHFWNSNIASLLHISANTKNVSCKLFLFLDIYSTYPNPPPKLKFSVQTLAFIHDVFYTSIVTHIYVVVVAARPFVVCRRASHANQSPSQARTFRITIILPASLLQLTEYTLDHF